MHTWGINHCWRLGVGHKLLSYVKEANEKYIVFYLLKCITLYNFCQSNKQSAILQKWFHFSSNKSVKMNFKMYG